MKIRLTVLSFFFAAAALAQYPVDYTVYFWPDPSYPPEKEIANGQEIERRYAIMYNVGQGGGTDSYKYLLRVFAPNGSIACEATTVVAPWNGRDTMRKIAYFEAIYPIKKTASSNRPPAGKYGLIAFIFEQVPPGGTAQDNVNGNIWPPYVNGAPSGTVPFEVRPGVEQVKCGLVPTFPIFKGNLKIPH